MVRDYKGKENSVTYIKPYFNTIQLGRTIASNGCIPVLALLFENPKLYTEILIETEIPGTTLNRALKLLLSISLIKKDRTISKGRDTHIYSISQMGKELIKRDAL